MPTRMGRNKTGGNNMKTGYVYKVVTAAGIIGVMIMPVTSIFCAILMTGLAVIYREVWKECLVVAGLCLVLSAASTGLWFILQRVCESVGWLS